MVWIGDVNQKAVRKTGRPISRYKKCHFQTISQLGLIHPLAQQRCGVVTQLGYVVR
jgi:hypothetical protein